MARSRQTNSSRNSRNRKTSGGGKSFIYIGLAVLCIVLVGGLVWWLIRDTGEYRFQRADLDKYIEVTYENNELDSGASVYVDMSDGMNFAYSTPESKAMLQAVINKLAANNAINFFELADSKIIPLQKSHTELYNYMLNPASYNRQKAPIEAALAEIVKKRQPAILMTDFEEYNGGVIHKAAYAKQYFIDWLASGYNINFYKWDFTERDKAKHMFIAVFDDNSNRLNSMINTAVTMTDSKVETYVLGSRDFAYPTSSQYLSLKQGGNYHNSKDKDAVTAVMEKGGPEDYVSYAKPYANASGTVGEFAPLDTQIGSFAEYYPLGVTWSDAIKNSKIMQEEGIPEEDRFHHLLQKIYIDFGAQDGYSIDRVEARVFDMQPIMRAIGEKTANGETISLASLNGIGNPEINMVLTAGMESQNLPQGWKEIYVDFDEKFDGNFIGESSSTNLIRANVVISKATPDIDRANKFFNWEGNPSLFDSVKETLTASTSNPAGRVLFTYYLKTLAE